MNKKVLRRNEVNSKETWDLTRLYKDETLYNNDLELLAKLVNDFVGKYEGKLNDAPIIVGSIKDYMELLKVLTYTSTFQSLHSSVDQTDINNLKRSGEFSIFSNSLQNKLTFYNSELLNVSDEILKEVIKIDNNNEMFINDIIDNKKHQIDPIIEKTLSMFSPVLNLPYSNYNSFKFGDMNFNDFKVNDKTYPNSFSMFENEWSYELDHQVRREAFKSFYTDLKQYQTGFANNYAGQVLKEKAYAKLKGFNSTIEYLLFNQKVSVDMYDRQIDLIMEHLSKPMQNYAKLIKEIHNLDKVTYADLHLSIDPEYEPTITIEEAKNYSVESLKVFGDEYRKMVENAFDERWIDFPQNQGKSTGGFCSSPYQKGSYILLN